MSFNDIMQRAQGLQEDMQKFREQMLARTVEGTGAEGAVVATLGVDMKFKDLQFAQSFRPHAWPSAQRARRLFRAARLLRAAPRVCASLARRRPARRKHSFPFPRAHRAARLA